MNLGRLDFIKSIHLKPDFVHGNKVIFVYFLTISGIIHLIIIFSSSNFSHILRPDHNYNDNESKNNNYVVEIDLEPDKQEEENLESEEVDKEEEYAEEDMAKEDEQLFVDTSESDVDEETQADTNKIGEKGSTAKDMYTGNNDINDQPRLESDVETPGETPDELATTVSEASGMPVAVYSEPVNETADESVQALVEEKTADSLPEVSESEDKAEDDEVEVLEEIQDEAVVRDVNAAEAEEEGSQTLSDDGVEQVMGEENVASTTRESDIAILVAESLKKNEIEPDLIEGEIGKKTDAVEEYTETASIPKATLKEVVEGKEESVSKKAQDMLKATEAQPSNVPMSNGVPYFEDKISNAPIKGAESFNVKKHEYAPYYKQIRDKIRLYWLLQYGTDHSINQVTKEYKPIVVTFKVLPEGNIVNVVIVDPAGNELLASKIKKSIQNTALDTFPEYIDEKHIDVKFSYFFF